MEEERDIVVFADEEGNEIELEVIDYFVHNDEEYAVLIEANEEEAHDHEDCDCHDHEHDYDLYIMKVVVNGDMEEFIPVEEDQLDELVEIVQQRMSEDMEDYDEDELEDEDEE